MVQNIVFNHVLEVHTHNTPTDTYNTYSRDNDVFSVIFLNLVVLSGIVCSKLGREYGEEMITA